MIHLIKPNSIIMNSTRNKKNGKNGNRRTKRQPKLKKKLKKTTLKKRQEIKGGVNPRRVGRAVTRNGVAYQPPDIFVDNLPVRRKKCDPGFRYNKGTEKCDPKPVFSNLNINRNSSQNNNQNLIQYDNQDDNNQNNDNDDQDNNDLNRRAKNVRQQDKERERIRINEANIRAIKKANKQVIAPNPEVIPDQDIIENANLLGMNNVSIGRNNEIENANLLLGMNDPNNPNIRRNNDAIVNNDNFVLRMDGRQDSFNPRNGINNDGRLYI